MTIQILLHNGTDTDERIYRQIAKHNYTDYIQGFYVNREAYQSGEMYQLKGKERLLLHSFGKGQA